MREAIVIERKEYLRGMIKALEGTQVACAVADCEACAACADVVSRHTEELALLDFEPRSGALKL